MGIDNATGRHNLKTTKMLVVDFSFSYLNNKILYVLSEMDDQLVTIPFQLKPANLHKTKRDQYKR